MVERYNGANVRTRNRPSLPGEPTGEVKLIPTALTIAGSDPSGGAGIQADLKTFSALKVYGMSVVTAITAQNTRGVSTVFDVLPAAVNAQLDAVMSDIRPDAVKIGMLRNAANTEALADELSQYEVELLILDPVMVSTSGTQLLTPDGVDVLRTRLLPMSFLLTPNLDEAEALLGRSVRTPAEMEEAARALYDMGARHVLVKGGHLQSDAAVDVFFDGRRAERLRGERIPIADSHGTGCVLSAAITAYLARGGELREAVSKGKVFTERAVRNGLRLGKGSGPCDPLGLRPVTDGE